MKANVLEQAKTLMRRRKFYFAIKLLEQNSHHYQGSFEYYLALGTSCLYAGDIGNAQKYYQMARGIKINDEELLLGQAAIFLHKGNTKRALEYYLNILDMAPNNETAHVGLNFIRNYHDYTEICKIVDTGEIKRFYPPLGINPDVVRNCVFLGLLLGIIASIFIVKCSPFDKKDKQPSSAASGYEALALNSLEKRAASGDELAGGGVTYFVLSDEQINASYTKALNLFKQKRENASLVEVNRILASNASSAIKEKARTLREEIFKDGKTHADVIPEFSTLKDNFTYEEVNANRVLFKDCFVVWVGKVANIENNEDGSWKCTFLVYNKEFNKFFGFLTVNFLASQPPVNEENPIMILGRVKEVNSSLELDGKIVYQSVKNKDLYDLLKSVGL